jgi:uncharacterized protein DUF998
VRLLVIALGAPEVGKVAGVCSLAASAVAIGVLVYLHLAPTGLSPLRTAVSQYGISAYRAWYRVMTISMGVAGGAIALALSQLPAAFDAGAVVALLAVFATCRAAISWFPMDAPGSPRTSTGAAHGLLAAVTFGAVAAGAIRLCKVLEHDPRLDLLATTSRVLGWLMVALFALLLLSRLGPELRRYFGATERGLYLAILTWLVVVGVACATGHAFDLGIAGP